MKIDDAMTMIIDDAVEGFRRVSATVMLGRFFGQSPLGESIDIID